MSAAFEGNGLAELRVVEESATANRLTARNKWNEHFSVQARCPKVEEFTEQTLTRRIDASLRPWIQILLAQFAMYIVQMTKKNKDDEYYAFGSLKQWLSGVHTYLFEKFPHLTILQKDRPEGAWYGKMYRQLRRETLNFAFRRGEKTQKIVQGIRIDLVIDIVLYLCQMATKASVRLIFLVLLLYNFCGRAGELGLITIQNAKWIDGATFFTLPNSKTVKEQLLDAYPHYDNHLLDMFYWMATHLMLNPHEFSSVANREAWLFKDLREMYGDTANPFDKARTARVAQSVTNELKRTLAPLFGEDSAKKDDFLTSHMFRHGAADDMVLNQAGRNNCSVLIGAMYRGAWDFASECEFFNYLFKQIFITEAAKAAQGYPNAKMKVAHPTLQIILDNCPNEQEREYPNR